MDPLIKELENLAKTDYPLVKEARALLEMAVEAQRGKPIDLKKLQELTNDELSTDHRPLDSGQSETEAKS